MVVEVELAGGSKVKMPGSPMKFSVCEELKPKSPPLLGEHTDQVLSDLCQFSAEHIDSLSRRGVIAQNSLTHKEQVS